jgi:hypothetical protein
VGRDGAHLGWRAGRARSESEREGRQGGWGAEGNVATVMGGAGAASSDGRGDVCVDDGVGAAETVHAWDGASANSLFFFFFTRRSTDQHATHNSSGVRPHR